MEINKFLNLKPEKQERILNAALKEFAKKGYKNAMTDEIAKEANISKGALFQYFTNKKALFLFLYDHTLDIVMREYFQKINMDEKDILKRLKQILFIEFTLLKKYPDLFDFIEVVNHEESIEVINDLRMRNKEYVMSSYDKLMEGIDTSLFKEDVEISRAINVIIWTMEGFGKNQKEQMKQQSLTELNFDVIFAEADIYCELLTKLFYK